MKKDSRKRRWFITVNNPVEKGYDDNKIRELINSYGDSCIYACYCYEMGLETNTLHFHLYIQFENARAFSTMQNKFSGSHLEMAKGTAQENRDYIRKEGKYENTDKKETNMIDTFWEVGELPIERQGQRTDWMILKELIQDGYSNVEIIDENPGYMKHIDTIDKIRNEFISEEYSQKIRNVEVIYIYGDSGAGKTRYVTEKHGFKNAFRVTDYSHPFDKYNSQGVLIFEEFRSNFPIESMLNYLDIYPVDLPCRYNNKYACYETVYIISNISLDEQYINIQNTQHESYRALIRRIHKIMEFKDGEIRLYNSYEQYKNNEFELLNITREDKQ